MVKGWQRKVMEVAMETIELKLDEQTLERARQLAAARHVTLEELLKEALVRLNPPTAREDSVLGMFADEPELLDEIVEEAMQARERDSFRLNDG